MLWRPTACAEHTIRNVTAGGGFRNISPPRQEEYDEEESFALFTAMFLLCGMLAGCGPTGSSSTTTDGSDDGAKDTLIVAIPESPTYMDPMVQASIGTYRVTTQMFDRLVMMDNDMNLVPGLAESWEVIDDTTTVFHLRQGVKFHNGEEMTSEDVKYSLERCIANPGVNYNYLIIESITCDDDYTVTIKTSAPFNALLYRLSLDAASIICKSADTSAEEFNKNPVGTGPFKFVSWELGGDVVLEAFEDYWGGAPAVKRVIFRTIPEALNRTIGLETGEVDLAYDLGITDLESLADNASVTTLTSPSTTVWYVGMNVQKAPFDNEKVRQAVAYALDPRATSTWCSAARPHPPTTPCCPPVWTATSPTAPTTPATWRRPRSCWPRPAILTASPPLSGVPIPR
ncbi:MAG: ABC transporter substrate-binding protein [Oscillibacter sp.]|nr:ABC transporter substrate-binding protein [Oscillibacter sp.]